MFEGIRAFGKRKPVETAPEGASTFEHNRPMYERVRAHRPEIDQLLTQLDEITAHQSAGHGVREDQIRIERIQEQISETYRRIA